MYLHFSYILLSFFLFLFFCLFLFHRATRPRSILNEERNVEKCTSTTQFSQLLYGFARSTAILSLVKIVEHRLEAQVRIKLRPQATMDVIITIMLRTTRKSLTVSLFTIRLGKLRDNNENGKRKEEWCKNSRKFNWSNFG